MVLFSPWRSLMTSFHRWMNGYEWWTIRSRMALARVAWSIFYAITRFQAESTTPPLSDFRWLFSKSGILCSPNTYWREKHLFKFKVTVCYNNQTEQITFWCCIQHLHYYQMSPIRLLPSSRKKREWKISLFLLFSCAFFLLTSHNFLSTFLFDFEV